VKLRGKREEHEKKIMELRKVHNPRKKVINKIQTIESLLILKSKNDLLIEQINITNDKFSVLEQELMISNQKSSPEINKVQYINDKYNVMISDLKINNSEIAIKIFKLRVKLLFAYSKLGRNNIKSRINDLKIVLLDKTTLKIKINRFKLLRESELYSANFKNEATVKYEKKSEINKIRNKIKSNIYDFITRPKAIDSKKAEA
jgi:hypothetical protein